MVANGKLIGITGATGVVGGEVASRLARRGIRQRLIVRDPQRAPLLPGVEVRQASGYDHAEAMTRALRGVQTLFLISGDLSPDRAREHSTAVDAALAAGVERIVYLSFLNAAADAVFHAAREHFHTEEHIRDRGVPFTFLRSSFYASSVLRWGGEEGIVRGPAGEGRVSWVTRDDIADEAAIVLTSSGHDGQIYNNTGPEALTLAETAALISEVSGGTFSYHQETLEEARQSRAKYGAPDNVVEIWISTYTAIAAGELSLVSQDIPRLTGHPARSMRDFLREHPESYQHLLKQ